jgi:hypothetical protein
MAASPTMIQVEVRLGFIVAPLPTTKGRETTTLALLGINPHFENYRKQVGEDDRVSEKTS